MVVLVLLIASGANGFSSTPGLPAAGACQSAILVEADTGIVLFGKNPHKAWHAASLTKMMVGLVALEEVRAGRMSLDEPVTVSRRAARVGGHKMYLRAGQRFSLAELLQAMLVSSANDAAVVVAEGLAGDVDTCIRAMNRRANELGMTHTRYRTVNGLPLPEGKPGDLCSAADVATLARALLRYPLVLDWTSRQQVVLRGGRLRLRNTNRLAGHVNGVDGFKTGYHSRAGFNLAVTAERDGLRLICVVMGGASSGTRFQIGANLLEWGFGRFGAGRAATKSGQLQFARP